jgi:hypothetical protein
VVTSWCTTGGGFFPTTTGGNTFVSFKSNTAWYSEDVSVGSARELFGWGAKVSFEVLFRDWSELVSQSDIKNLGSINFSVDHLVEGEQVIVGDWGGLRN